MPVTLSPSQQETLEAFRDFLSDPGQLEFLIAGFAGSGKSFLVSHLIHVIDREYQVSLAIDPNTNPTIMFFTATTNKAANVLSEMLGREADTIHKLLGLVVKTDYTTGKKSLVQKGPCKLLSDSIVFVDEASMVTHELLANLRKAAAKFRNVKIVYIGDNYQLPPVKEEFCPVFQSNMPRSFLKEIQRQVAGSPIIQLASKYRMMLDNHQLEWPEIVPDNQSIFHYTVKEDWFAAVQQGFLPIHDVDDVKVLAWSNDRVREYNTWIRNFSGQTGDFALGETVQTNKPLQWQDNILASTDSAHLITRIDFAIESDIPGYRIELRELSNHNAHVVFQPKDWREATALANTYAKKNEWKAYYGIKNDWADLRAVHAQTVHKAQGSTYRDVYIDLTNIGRNNKWQEVARLVYVAVTRASRQVHIFGNLLNRYEKKPVINRREIFQNAANS